MKEKPIIALDFASKTAVTHFLTEMQPAEPLFLKVGMELFYAEGSRLLYDLKAQGHQLFLDLKLHDIPNTVKSAMRVLAGLEVDIVNVHAAGGQTMMAAAKEGLLSGSASGKTPAIIAVTQLTSTSEAAMQAEQQIPLSLEESVLHYSGLAQAAGMDGVVCSAKEASLIHAATSADFLCVTPGIRLAEDSNDDQKRVVTPAAARKFGASAIVVGRSITNAAAPAAAYQKICQEWRN